MNRVTEEQVRANMQDVQCQTIYVFGKPMTFVGVKMQNGFVITDCTSCVDPNNYDEEIGKQICLKHIEDKVWELLGFNLQYEVSAKNQVLASTRDMMLSPDYKERLMAEYIQLDNRMEGLTNMLKKWDAGELEFEPTCPKEVLYEQLNCMCAYHISLQQRASKEGIKLF